MACSSIGKCCPESQKNDSSSINMLFVPMMGYTYCVEPAWSRIAPSPSCCHADPWKLLLILRMGYAHVILSEVSPGKKEKFTELCFGKFSVSMLIAERKIFWNNNLSQLFQFFFQAFVNREKEPGACN